MQPQRVEAAQHDHTKILRSAKDAAWEATDAALRAANAAENSMTLARSAKTRATMGLVCAALAAIAAIAPLVVPMTRDKSIHHIESQLRAWGAVLIANSSREQETHGDPTR
jgi:hypothetical protein